MKEPYCIFDSSLVVSGLQLFKGDLYNKKPNQTGTCIRIYTHTYTPPQTHSLSHNPRTAFQAREIKMKTHQFSVTVIVKFLPLNGFQWARSFLWILEVEYVVAAEEYAHSWNRIGSCGQNIPFYGQCVCFSCQWLAFKKEKIK